MRSCSHKKKFKRTFFHFFCCQIPVAFSQKGVMSNNFVLVYRDRSAPYSLSPCYFSTPLSIQFIFSSFFPSDIFPAAFALFFFSIVPLSPGSLFHHSLLPRRAACPGRGPCRQGRQGRQGAPAATLSQKFYGYSFISRCISHKK